MSKSKPENPVSDSGVREFAEGYVKEFDRLLRGADWRNHPRIIGRYRRYNYPSSRHSFDGFRIARTKK